MGILPAESPPTISNLKTQYFIDKMKDIFVKENERYNIISLVLICTSKIKENCNYSCDICNVFRTVPGIY